MLFGFLCSRASSALGFAGDSAGAFQAPSSTVGVLDDVLWRELVAVLAVCLARIQRGWTFAAKHVLAVGDRLKMLRVDTQAHAAEMVQAFAMQASTCLSLVDVAVRFFRHSVAHDDPVALCLGFAAPDPARCIERAGSDLVLLADFEPAVVADDEAMGPAPDVASSGVSVASDGRGLAASALAEIVHLRSVAHNTREV